jgi:cell division protein FtsQ
VSSVPHRKRRRRSSPVRRLRPFWFLVIVLLALGVVGGYLLLTWPALDPHTIEVTGNRVVPKAQIVEHARIDLTQNMWLQNTGAMTARIEAIPYIDSAYVHRRPPDTIAIAVTERAPYAVVRSRSGVATVDSTLRVLQAGAAALPVSLPSLDVPAAAVPAPGRWIQDNDVDTLARVAASAARAQLAPDDLSYDRFGDIVLRLRSGVSVLLGDGSELEKKLALVDPILSQASHGRRITAVDLRALTTPVVEYAPKR